MPARALVFALLLSCSSLAVMALSLMEEPLRDLPMRVPSPLTITQVNWRMEENNTLQLCTLEVIPEGQAVLLWGVILQEGKTGVVLQEGKTESVEEKEDDGDPNCSIFQMSSKFRLPAELTLYQLSVQLPAEPTFYQLSVEPEKAIGFAAFGSIEFAMTAQTSILVCGVSRVTKLSWTTDSPITYNGECIKAVGAPLDTYCYIEQSFSNQELCFDVTSSAVKVCLTGQIDDAPSGVADELSVSSLAYGPPSAVLSLKYAEVGQDPASMRAIVRLAADPAIPTQPGLATVYDCPAGSCTMVPETAPVYGMYEVCGEAIAADGHTVQTATATIIDLNLIVFEGGTNVLELAFANGFETRNYTASLFDNAALDGTAIDTISVDCTEVEADHICFGFFSTPTVGPLYVALSNTNDSNKIIAPFPAEL